LVQLTLREPQGGGIGVAQLRVAEVALLISG
jgi:hypothetical protein